MGRDHILKHVSLGRKVNAYLAPRQGGSHAAASEVDSWFARLERQLYDATLKHVKENLPTLSQVLEWVLEVCEDALGKAKAARRGFGLDLCAAKSVQRAIIANLVSGLELPPVRLHIVKTALHPEYVGQSKCPDPDCRDPERCMGNHFKLDYDAPNATPRNPVIKLWGPHHKNDWRGYGPIDTTYPAPSLLGQLMHIHVTEGHHLITTSLLRNRHVKQVSPHAGLYICCTFPHNIDALLLSPSPHQSMLFTTNSGLPFTDENFSVSWTKFLEKTANGRFANPFPATLIRTLFIEGYTGALGLDESHWEGCATMMGNTVRCLWWEGPGGW